MNKIKYLFQLSILFSYTILSSGCYTMINPPIDEEQITEESSDSLNVDGDYTIINNYTCSNNEASCCEHDYCHTHTDSQHYHSCDGHCSLTFNWWTSTWVSYSCNYCHHWSCSGHHHGHFYGHGYFHHNYHHNNYHYGYHDGFYDGYWWGYNDGWWDNENGDNDYSDWGDDQIERRDNSFDRTETDNSFGNNSFTVEALFPEDISNNNTGDSSYNKKYNSDTNLASIINSTINSKENINTRVEKRNNVALNVAKFLFTSYINSDKSSSYSSKSKSSKKDKSSSYSSKTKSSNSKKSYKSSKSSKKVSRDKRERR